MTKVIDHSKINIKEIVRVLKNGGVIAMPTDTVYGLACDFFNLDALTRIYEIKGRPKNMPLIAMLSSVSDLDKITLDITPDIQALAFNFWPGALTMVLNAKPSLPKIAIAGGKTVGVRIPDHSVALQILEHYAPLATTSANPSGMPAPDNAGDVIKHLVGRVDIIIDGGLTDSGVASTVLDCTKKPFQTLREGTVKDEYIKQILKSSKKILCEKSFTLDEN